MDRSPTPLRRPGQSWSVRFLVGERDAHRAVWAASFGASLGCVAVTAAVLPLWVASAVGVMAKAGSQPAMSKAAGAVAARSVRRRLRASNPGVVVDEYFGDGDVHGGEAFRVRALRRFVERAGVGGDEQALTALAEVVVDRDPRLALDWALSSADSRLVDMSAHRALESLPGSGDVDGLLAARQTLVCCPELSSPARVALLRMSHVSELWPMVAAGCTGGGLRPGEGAALAAAFVTYQAPDAARYMGSPEHVVEHLARFGHAASGDDAVGWLVARPGARFDRSTWDEFCCFAAAMFAAVPVMHWASVLTRDKVQTHLRFGQHDVRSWSVPGGSISAVPYLTAVTAAVTAGAAIAAGVSVGRHRCESRCCDGRACDAIHEFASVLAEDWELSLDELFMSAHRVVCSTGHR
jgi:hypothetical protein